MQRKKFPLIGHSRKINHVTSIKEYVPLTKMVPKCYHNLKNLIKQPICYMNPQNQSCVDLILTNAVCSFPRTWMLGAGLPDFDLMLLAVMRNILANNSLELCIIIN